MAISINGSTGISGVNGSAATPVIKGGDADTGIFFGTDTASVATAGSERLLVDASGNINIDSGGVYYDAANNRLGVGTTSPNFNLSVKGSADSLMEVQSSSNNRIIIEANAAGNNRIYARNGSNGNGTLEFRTGTSTETMRIDTSGRLLVGTTSYDGNSAFVIKGGASQNVGLVDIRYGATRPTGADVQVSEVRFGSTDLTSNTSYASIQCITDGASTSDGDIPGRLVFATTSSGASSPTERMRIGSDGRTITTANVPGAWAYSATNDGDHNNRFGIKIQCGTDSSSGTNYAIAFHDGNNTPQGYITFSNGTVTYGPFTAHHPCILPEVDNDSGYPYGTLLEITSIEYTQKDGQDTERGIVYNVRKTQSANSRAVLGAYGSSMNGGPEGETNRHQAWVLGDGHILCNNSGGNIKVGDGICSSATPGIGQKATASPSMIIGIAQENVSFADDTEEKLVAVQYGLQQFIPWS